MSLQKWFKKFKSSKKLFFITVLLFSVILILYFKYSYGSNYNTQLSPKPTPNSNSNYNTTTPPQLSPQLTPKAGEGKITLIFKHNPPENQQTEVVAEIDGVNALTNMTAFDTFHCHWNYFEVIAKKGKHKVYIENKLTGEKDEEEFELDDEISLFVYSSQNQNMEIEVSKSVGCE